MIPLRDTIPSRRWPVMNVLIIIATFAVFLHQQQLLQLNPELFEKLIDRYGLIPARFSQSLLSGKPDFLPFVTYMLLHSGWMHVIGNLWALWLFGDNVEDRMGSFRYLLFYLSCGIIAGAVHFWIEPTSNVVTIGASGAIAGVMGAYFIMYPSARIVTLIPIVIIPLFVPIPAWIYLGFWLVSQIYSLVVAQGAPEMASNIAFAAHIGGFVAGMFGQRFFVKSRRSYHY